MKVVNIQAAKTHLSRLVDEAAAGDEEIVIAKAGKPLVRLVPYSAAARARVPGALEGQVWEAPDCWTGREDPLSQSADAPLFHGAVEEPPARE